MRLLKKKMYAQTIFKLAFAFTLTACGGITIDSAKDSEPENQEPVPVPVPGDPNDPMNQLEGPKPIDLFPGLNPQPLGGEPESLSLTAGLKPVENCSEAAGYIQNLVYLRLKADFERRLQWFQPYQKSARSSQMDEMQGAVPEAAPMQEAVADDSSNASGPEDYTTTNTQVAGVDEGDFVKNTGTHIFMVHHNKLEIVQSWPVESMKTLASLPFPDRPIEMVLTENNKLVIATRPAIAKIEPEPGSFGTEIYWGSYRPQFDWNTVRIYTVDISNLEAPKIEKTWLLQGDFKGLRQVGNTVQTVLSQYMDYRWDLKNVDYKKIRQFTQKEELRAYLQQLLDENMVRINERPLSEWLTSSQSWYGSHTLENESDRVAFDSSCGSIYLPLAPTAEGLTTVATLDAATGELSSSTLLAKSETVYASKTSLYTGMTTWWDGFTSIYTPRTFIHKFDISTPGKAQYKASGVVPGNILNQFALDEFKDHLRVAVTERITNEEANQENWWRATTTINRVYVLGEQEGALKTVGQTEGLAKGERIYSVRFMGERGFVVTFRETDPLYSMDLSDPQQPKVLGELKIPGFSNYLHPITENHLLGVGQEADPTNGRVLGLKLSIFDVSDLTNPIEAHTWQMENLRYSTSQAQYNHKAFTYYGSRQTLAIPVSGYAPNWDQTYWWGRYESSLNLFKIDPVEGIAPSGKVYMTDLYQGNELPWYRWYRHAQVERSIFADDYVYAISNSGIRVSSLDNPSQPLSQAEFTCDSGCLEGWWY